MKNIFFLTAFLFSFTVSCTASDDEYYPKEYASNEDSSNVAIKEEYKILVMGNSLSRDAFSYVPAIMKNCCENVSFVVNILYRGNKSLANHWLSISKGSADYTLDTCSSEDTKWQLRTKVIGGEVICSQMWDMIVLQEGSQTARNYESMQPSVHQIVNYIRGVQPNANIAFMINPPHAEGYSDLGDNTSDEIWIQYVTNARKLKDEKEVDYIIPCGTGVQNARHTYLDSLGTFGHLSYDGRHLQEGIPCIIDAYTATQSLFRLFNISASIENSNMIITQQWVNAANIPGKHGSVIVGSNNDYTTSKRCAFNAVEFPFNLTKDAEDICVKSPTI